MLKFISGNRFLFSCCAAIFLLSIFLRSLIDIGPDTGIYLDLGRKVALGQRYYYDFFESNFPLSFYFYALQYRASLLLGIDPIILSEIVINLLAIAAIFWSAKILARSDFGHKRAHYNLIIIAYFLGFFLRLQGLPLGEFGTKTSLFLLLFYPYFSYSFPRVSNFNRKDLVARGILMGLMPCLKPNYIIVPLTIEIYQAWQKKSLRLLFELDKLIAALIYVSYLLWMLKFMPEFFEMIVPMWLKIYGSYGNDSIFLENSYRLFAAHIGIFTFVFLIFSRLKPSADDKILITFFVAAVLLFFSENAMTIDQSVIFYAVVTICVVKFGYDFFTSSKLVAKDNIFILSALLVVPAFDLGVMPAAVFGLTGLINFWWFLAPFLLRRNWRFLLVYFASLLALILVLKNFGKWPCVAFNLLLIFGLVFFYEKKIQAKSSNKFSVSTIFLIAAAISSLFFIYVNDVFETVTRKNDYSFPNKISDMINYYSKEFTPNKDDGFLVFSSGNGMKFPRLNYLQKVNYQKFHTASIQAGPASGSNGLMFRNEDILVSYYLFDDIKTTLKNPHIKVVFVNNTPEYLNKQDRCIIGALEYYLLDYDFRNFFLKNFRFKDRVINEREVKVMKNVPLITGIAPSVFDQVTKSNKQIAHDFEIYIRQ